MLVKLAIVALSAALASPALAQTSNETQTCSDFHLEMTTKLATGLDSLQLNILLFEAARKACIEEVNALLAHGASRLARDREGDTALGNAARRGKVNVIDALLAGASAEEARQIELADVHGSTPLIIAAIAGRSAAARRLIDAGADVNAVNTQGETALAAAAYTRDAEFAALLIQHGAKPDVVDRTGKSPMIYAAAQGAERIVVALIDAGVDPNKRYGADLTALMWAAGYANTAPATEALQTVKLLLARGAKLELVDDRGRDALMIAASLGHAEIVKTLLDAGADPSRRDKTDKRAADLTTSPDIKAMLGDKP